MRAWSHPRKLAALIAAIAALAVGGIVWIYAGGLTYQHQSVIRSDGQGYYVYLPAAFLDHDLTMRKTADRTFGGDPRYIAGLNWVTDNRGYAVPLDQFGVGSAVLMTPFFAAGHVLAMAAGTHRNGFSWPYQYADGAAALVYFLLGLVLLSSVLRRWFSSGTTLVTLAAIAFGGTVFHYATYDAFFSHAYSFFVTALVLRLSIALWERPRAGVAAALGASIGLAGLVRMTNLVVAVIPALIGIERIADLRKRPGAILRRIDLLALGAAAFCLVMLLQVGYWHRVTGHLFVNPYAPTGAYMDLLRPHLVGVLFSVRKGLFFWSPLMILAVVGLPYLRRRAPALFLPAVVFLAVETWVVASWSVWWYGGSLGMRPLVDAMPVFALGLAALIDAVRGTYARRALAVAVAATSLLAVHSMVSYWLKTIPYDGTTFSQFVDSFTHY